MKNKLLLIFNLFVFNCYGQSLEGTSGIINTPTARMLEDNVLVFGAAYIPKPYFYRNRSVGKNPGVNTYITYGILPFVEIMFRYSHELNIPVSPETSYFPDRMFSARVLVSKEKKNIPSIVFGVHDIGWVFGRSINFNKEYRMNYFVLSKKFHYSILNIDISAGHTFTLLGNNSKRIEGLFYGFKLNIFDQKVKLIFENHNLNKNFGLEINPNRKINLNIGMLDFDKLFFSSNYKIF